MTNKKKTLILILLASMGLFILSFSVSYAACIPEGTGLNCQGQTFVKLMSGFTGLGGGQVNGIIPLLKVLFDILLAGASILAVIFIAIGGFEIMSRDTPFYISEGKDRIQHAIIGLLIIIGSYVILWTINPDLVSLNIFKNLQPILVPGATTIPIPPTAVPTTGGSTTSGTTTGGTGTVTIPPPPPPLIP